MPEENDSYRENEGRFWKKAAAEKLSVLIDGEAYFRAARQAIVKARRRICLLAWEFHSQTNLEREAVDDGYPIEIGPLLNVLLEEREELEVYILVWDYALIYIHEREWTLFSDWLKKPHPRLHFVSDKTAPSGASHHQKVLTIDDSLAFSGGLDLSISRWDTPEHKPNDERRINPDGEPHDPYHDIHAVMEGPIVKHWQELFAYRWKQATEKKLEPLSKYRNAELWPQKLDPDFLDVTVIIYQIQASPTESPSQIEQLHFDLISSAKEFLYIENQYLSSKTISDAIAQRLGEKNGPEVVIVLPSTTSGWLVESTVGLLRNRLLELLFEADQHNRLRVFAPFTFSDDGGKIPIYVHAKLLIADDRILKIGSSNLSNRSMSVDSECDLTIETEEPDKRIRGIRQKLLAGHFGRSLEEWQTIESEHETLIPALDSRRGKDSRRRLEYIEYGLDSDLKRSLADSQMLDPEDPIDPEYLIQKNLNENEKPLAWKGFLIIVASIAIAAILGITVYWTMGTYFGKQEALQFAQSIADNPWSPLFVFLIFAIGGTSGIPLNFMLITTAVTLGSQIAIIYGISGAMASSCLGFALGSLLGKPFIRKLSSNSVDAINEKLGERSFRSVAFIRLIPIAPFFIVNMVAGASQLKFKEYLLGTTLGMAPGMCAVVLIANRVEAVARRPDWFTTASLAVVVALLVFAVNYLRRTLGVSKSKG